MMEHRYIIVIDEQSQKDRLSRIASNLLKDGVELHYRELNPSHYTRRFDNGDIEFDREMFVEALKEVPFINQIDVFATDYNLSGYTLKGTHVLDIFLNILPRYKRAIVIYSAKIETVLQDIITEAGNSIDNQVDSIKQITGKNNFFFKSDGEFENKFKQLILSSPDISIERRLIDELHYLDTAKITCNLPPFNPMSTHELADLLESNTRESQKFKKELVDHLIALLFEPKEYV